jgi:hypothetical protein
MKNSDLKGPSFVKKNSARPGIAKKILLAAKGDMPEMEEMRNIIAQK